MGCYQGHVFDVDQSTFAQCFDVIRPLVRDPSKLERLSQRYPTPLSYRAKANAQAPLL